MTNRRIVPGPYLGVLVEAAKGLAHPARLRLLGMLSSGELCVCQMTALLGLAPSTVSKHLSVLAHGGLVRERKEGKLVFYRLREDGLAATLLPPFLSLLDADFGAPAERSVVARLREVPISTLCAAELDLAAVGVRPPGGNAPLQAHPGRDTHAS
jgi:ArsR family transcriptional regulator, arsenate/arsenite/antimonite-responsive transcriptional repressor